MCDEENSERMFFYLTNLNFRSKAKAPVATSNYQLPSWCRDSTFGWFLKPYNKKLKLERSVLTGKSQTSKRRQFDVFP